jgi:hypothetical protein
MSPPYPPPGQPTAPTQPLPPFSQLQIAAIYAGCVVSFAILRGIGGFLLLAPLLLLKSWWEKRSAARAKQWYKHGLIAYLCCSSLVLIPLSMGFIHGYKRRVAQSFHAPAGSSNSPEQSQEATIVFKARGCQLIAPLSWKEETKPRGPSVTLQVSSRNGDLSVAISMEPLGQSRPTEQEMATNAEQSRKRPMALLESDWVSLDKHKAWREVRVGEQDGLKVTWIFYFVRMESTAIQVVTAVESERFDQARQQLETIMKTAQCDRPFVNPGDKP